MKAPRLSELACSNNNGFIVCVFAQFVLDTSCSSLALMGESVERLETIKVVQVKSQLGVCEIGQLARQISSMLN